MIDLEIGEVNKKVLPEFSVIGKEGTGLAEKGSLWVPKLWDEVNQQFDELIAIVEPAVFSSVDMWGLMSDETTWLDPWKETGRYLAGIQFPTEVVAPIGWQRWVIPAMEYEVVKTDADHLDKITENMLTKVLPEKEESLVAAIQEHYLPDFKSGEVELYFPVKIL